MTGKRRQVRQTIERMIFKCRLNEYRPACDRKAWSRGKYCCAHHAGLIRTQVQAGSAIAAFAGESSINALIVNGFALKAVLHYCRVSGWGSSLDEYVSEEIALRDGK